MKKVFLFILIICSCTSVFALPYPITPRPLRKLVIESNVIVIGKVISVTDKVHKGKKKKNIYYPSYKIAKIAVEEILQGIVNKDTILVKFDPDMTCPMSAIYYENTSVLAFLDENGEYYDTHALSYGSKTLDSTGIFIYKTRIIEIQGITKIQDSIAKRNETIEWLVKCAENKITSWEGVYELNNHKEFSNSPHNKFKMDLDEKQKIRLKNAFTISLNDPYYDFDLSDLIYEDNKQEIDSILLHKLKNLKEDYYYYAVDYISRLQHKNSSQEMKQLLKRYYEIRFDSDSKLELNKIIVQFVNLVDI